MAFYAGTDGTMLMFDAPVAGAGSLQRTLPGINPAGVIAGSYRDTNSVSHGLVRERDGTFVTVAVSGAQNTGAVSTNAGGSITCSYTDAACVVRSFVTSPNN
jgi:hypothetical protein